MTPLEKNEHLHNVKKYIMQQYTHLKMGLCVSLKIYSIAIDHSSIKDNVF